MSGNNYALTIPPPTGFTNPSGVLIANYVNNSATTPPGSAYNVATPTLVGGVPVSAVLELQSTTASLLIPRMTTEQRDVIVTVANGMIVYDTDTTTFQFYQNGAWVSLSAGAGGVTGPGGGSTDTAVALWNGAGGNTLENSVVLISGGGAITGVASIANAVGSAAAPTYVFTARTTTGLYSSAANTVDVACNGVREFSVGYTAAAVDYISVTGSATNAANAALQPGFVASGTDTVIDVSITGKGAASGLAVLANSAGGAGSIKLWNPAGTFFSQLIGAAVAASKTWTLPLVDAAFANAPLVSNAAGVLSFNSAGMLSVTGTLTSANLKAMNAAPISLIAAPGANLGIIVHRFSIEYLYVTTAYAADGGSIFLTYGSSVAAAANAATAGIALTGLTDQVASTLSTASGVVTGVPTASITNTAVFISNTSVALATGDGTARWQIWYSVVTV